MRTLKKTLLALTLLSLPLTAVSIDAQARYRQTPKYQKNKTAYEVQRAHKLRVKTAPRFRKQAIPQPRVAPKRPTKPARTTIKPSTSRSYVSRSLHKQAGMNYFLRDQKIRVTNFRLNPNRISYSGSKKSIGWTARVKTGDGRSYGAFGMIRQQLQGQPKGLKRVKVQSGTPAPGVIVR
jgi:hypothetical protein